MRTTPIRTDLPPAHFQAIGEIIFAWSLLEHALRHVVYDLLQASPKIGRIAIRDPRARDMPAMIADILTVQGRTTPSNHKELTKRIKELEAWRNAIAHGVWLDDHHNDHPILQLTSADALPGFLGIKKPKIDPVGHLLSIENLKALRANIDSAREDVRRYYGALKSGEKSSPEKSPGQ